MAEIKISAKGIGTRIERRRIKSGNGKN